MNSHQYVRLAGAAVLALVVIPGVTRSASAQVRWTVDPEPVGRVAATSEAGVPRYGNAAWATRLPDGRLAIADGTDHMVRLFDQRGIPVGNIGRSGRGPGEFSSLGWIAQCGSDTLRIWDLVQARFHFVHPDAGYVRAASDPRQRGSDPTCSRSGATAFSIRGPRAAGAKPMTIASVPGEADYRIWRDSFDIQSWDASGALGPAYKGAMRVDILFGTLADGRIANLPRPMGLATLFALTDDGLFVARTDSGRVEHLAADGSVVARFTIGAPTRAPTRAEYEAAVEERVLGYPTMAHDQFRKLALLVPAPRLLPAFRAMLSDPRGVLWFVTSPAGAPTTTLQGVNASGAAVATLQVGAPLTVFEVGDSHLVGRTESADGEQEVVVYRFTRR